MNPTLPPEEILTHRTKGIPGGTLPFPLKRIAEKRWNVARGDMPLPLAILDEDTLAANAAWMRAFCAGQGVSIAPHGKTTMSPKLFRRQIEDGAWAMTLSTAHQVQVARDFGIARILVANQVVDERFLDYLLDELDRDEAFDVLVLMDSVEAARFAADHWTRKGHRRALGILVEVGVEGGRTGVRDRAAAIALAREIAAGNALELRGIEGFEGIFPGPAEANIARVDDLLRSVADVAEGCAAAGLFPGEIILSAGGSAYFDRVVAIFGNARLGRAARIVLRSGCYIAHDSRMYADYFASLGARVPAGTLPADAPRPALRVLARVQSVPEPGLALLSAGKRDVSYDIHLPIATHVIRSGGRGPLEPLAGCEIFALADQHAFMRKPAGLDLRIGNIVTLGISHPCTTFDKWDVVYGVDDALNVVSAYKTYF